MITKYDVPYESVVTTLLLLGYHFLIPIAQTPGEVESYVTALESGRSRSRLIWTSKEAKGIELELVKYDDRSRLL